MSFHYREALFYQLASSVFITPVSNCVVVAIRDNTATVCGQQQKCIPIYIYLAKREFHFIVLILEIIPVTTQNNLIPKDALKQTFLVSYTYFGG